MEILKYLDVLIGLAVVMVLLSPLVSAFTQLWMWVCNSRAGNLRKGLERILRQLESDPYEMFEAVEISGLAAGTVVTLQQPDNIVPVVRNAAAGATLTLTQNIPAMLRETHGDLTATVARAGGLVAALGFAPAPAPAAPAPSIRLWVRGNDPFTLKTLPTADDGAVVAEYHFMGPPQFASREFTVNPPAGQMLVITIDSGDFNGTPIRWNAVTGLAVYPQNIQPVPAAHSLRLVLGNAAGPVVGTALTLTFHRNTAVHPVTAQHLSLHKDEVKTIAKSVLEHNMVKQDKVLGLGRTQGEVVEREELIRILLEFAAKPAGPAQTKLQQILAGDGVPDASRALADIRTVAQQLELTAPAEAAHERLSKAILTAAQSAFVGKVNTWFDQTMARVSNEYKFRAQVVTILGALAVATCVQLDSIDLLRRLSMDDKLRESLITEAKAQQDRLANAQTPTAQDKDEIQLAKSRRDEIEANLAKMRDPQLGVLPDHFIWQALPKARLVKAEWKVPYSKRLELVLGTNTYPLEPVWSSDVVGSIAAAIRNCGAPVALVLEKHHGATVSGMSHSGKGVGDLQVLVGKADALTHVAGVASVNVNAATVPHRKLTMIVGYNDPAVVDNTAGSLLTAIQASSAAVSISPGPPLTLTALRPGIRWIELRDAHGNYLGPVETHDTARFDDLLFGDPQDTKGPRTGQCKVLLAGTTLSSEGTCSFDSILGDLKNAGFQTDTKPEDHLVLTSHRLGVVQLRAVPGKADSNMLNRAAESTEPPFHLWPPTSWIAFDWDLFRSSWRGVLLTWVLLSLGAPFWYDTLKDALKLRSSLATQEEKARKDRQTNTAPA